MPLRFISPVARSKSYRPDIDGLRALAVISIVVFHLNALTLPGGYVGVDIFFVISGYLITSIVLHDLASGKFSFAKFYERRMRRILPPLLTMLLVCVAAAVIMLAPADLSRFGRSLTATSGFVSNLWFATHSTNEGYFGHPSATQVLLHTWSLSVEEQFYFLFPVALWAAHVFGRRYRNAGLLLVLLASFSLSVYNVGAKHSRAFYLPQDRAWELLLGALPILIPLPKLSTRILREALAFAGLCLIASAISQFDEATPFPGWHALLPCGGALLLLYSGEQGETLVRYVLSFRPLVFVGVLSYSIYLWHWPLIAFLRYFQMDIWLTPREEWFVGLLSVLLAFLSFEWIEAPVREKRVLRSRTLLYVAALSGSICAGVAGWMLVASHGLVRRYPEAIRETLWANQRRRDDVPGPDKCISTLSPVLMPSDMIFCSFGPSSRRILFWGDSHVEQFLPLLEKLEANNAFPGQGLIFSLAPGCPPAVSIGAKQREISCEAIAQYTLDRAEKKDIDTVFIQFLPWWTGAVDRFCISQNGRCVRTAEPDEVARRTGDDLFQAITQLKSRGKRVILGLPFPAFDAPVPDFLLHKATFRSRAMSRQLHERQYVLYKAIELELARRTGIELFDPRQTLCPTGACIYEHHGVSIYHDESHLAASQTGIMAESLLRILNHTPSSQTQQNEVATTAAVRKN